MRIFIAGDWHCDIAHAKYCYEEAAQFDCDAILQVGDFGYWPRFHDGEAYLDELSNFYEQSGIPLFWIDGNHEDHLSLKAYPNDKMSDIRKGVTYIPRGVTWEWDGVKFMGFGGAWSIDRSARSLDWTWFKEEIPSDEDVERARAAGKVDVLFTHDVPKGIDMQYQMHKAGRRYGVGFPAAEHCRYLIREVVEATQPSVVYHGHYHLRYTEQLFADYAGPQGVRVEGIDANLQRFEEYGGRVNDSWTILDTKDLTDGA